MSAATPISWSESSERGAGSGFRSNFEHSPVPMARCNGQGMILENNAAFEEAFERARARGQAVRLSDLVPSQDRETTEAALRDVLSGRRSSARMEEKDLSSGRMITRWTAWRVAGNGLESTNLLVMGERGQGASAEEDGLQGERWEAVGRLAGGVVHDFNNLLTGVMLYCDLLLANLEQRDRRLRSYAEEIRGAVAQAGGLVRQLLVFSRPKSVEVRALCLNQVAEAMRDLVTRLIGENIGLELRLDAELGMVQMDAAQAQQILLNLILNARDAMPQGGRIVVQTGNCKFQAVGGSVPARLGTLPCVMLAVGDNGGGMDAETRARLFEPFFTTKPAGKGNGLGLTTVRGIVNANRGLIHVDSEPGRGTRVMIVLPRAGAELANGAPANSEGTHSAFQKVKKETIL